MTDVWRLYQDHADSFDRVRSRELMERAHLDAVAERLPTGGAVLDVGCGGGEPIAQYFIERGYALTGVDAAPAMIALCQKRWPQGDWIEADMRTLDLDRRFDAIIAWDSFFHLDQAAQASMIKRFARHMAPGGTLLVTTGPEAGEVYSDLFGAPLFHASLSPEDYRGLLGECGFQNAAFHPEDPDCGDHSVWLAEFSG